MNNGVLEAIRNRRTIRHFTEQEVGDKHIDLLLEAAMYAPNRLNRQPWHFFVVRDKRLRKNLADFLGLHPYLEEAPVLIAAAAQPELSTTWMMDLSAAVENMLIAATAMGLGTAWVGEPDSKVWTMAEEVMQDAFHIPDELSLRIPALIAVGYPAQQRPPHERSNRLDPTKIHYGVWEGPRLGAPGQQA
jgi:nitroreductase